MPEAARRWAERDAAVVWHGFTQMADYAGTAVVVDRAEGRELRERTGQWFSDNCRRLSLAESLDAVLEAYRGSSARS